MGLQNTSHATTFLIHFYSTDTTQLRENDIGYVTGMAIHRDDAGFLPNWKLDKVRSFYRRDILN